MKLTQIVSFVTKESIKNSKNNKLISKTEQRFRSEKHSVFTEEVNKTALSSNDDKKYNQLIKQKRMHTERVKIQYVRKNKLNVKI